MLRLSSVNDRAINAQFAAALTQVHPRSGGYAMRRPALGFSGLACAARPGAGGGAANEHGAYWPCRVLAVADRLLEPLIGYLQPSCPGLGLTPALDSDREDSGCSRRCGERAYAHTRGLEEELVIVAF